MRLTLRQYIDDPSLLDQISMSELQEWAEEVPYASLIRRLMAIKARHNTSDTSDMTDVFRGVLIHSSDPKHILSLADQTEKSTLEDIASSRTDDITLLDEEVIDKDVANTPVITELLSSNDTLVEEAVGLSSNEEAVVINEIVEEDELLKDGAEADDYQDIIETITIEHKTKAIPNHHNSLC